MTFKRLSVCIALLAATPAGAAPGRIAPVSPPAVTASHSPGAKFRDCPDCPEMMALPAGNFTMGSPPSEAGRLDREGPLHRVDIPHAFAVGITNVTREEYATFVRETGRPSGDGCYFRPEVGKPMVKDASKNWRSPGFEQTDRDPVVCVSWEDAQAYVQWLNSRVARPAQARSRPGRPGPYRLLTESEWEYAARGGTTTAYYWGDSIGSGNANCAGCGSKWDGKQTSPAGSFAANRFGLLDMAGNANQWVDDCYHDSYVNAPADGSSWTTGECKDRVLRGGSWYIVPRLVSSAFRYLFAPDYSSYGIGFRVARTL